MTHGITFLPNVDQIIVMRNGVVSEMGSYEELMKTDGAFAEFLRTYLAEVGSSDSDENGEIVFAYAFA